MPGAQEFKCMMQPEVFAPVPNAWRRQRWTTATLSKLSTPELKAALAAWRQALPKARHRFRQQCVLAHSPW
jgi:hypothetical protein